MHCSEPFSCCSMRQRIYTFNNMCIQFWDKIYIAYNSLCKQHNTRWFCGLLQPRGTHSYPCTTSITECESWGHQEGAMGKVLYCQACWLQFDHQRTHSWIREHAPISCPLTSNAPHGMPSTTCKTMKRRMRKQKKRRRIIQYSSTDKSLLMRALRMRPLPGRATL